ncbi:MAG: hypothetical protein AAFV88_14055 [Planctomycetota bacterium]
MKILSSFAFLILIFSFCCGDCYSDFVYGVTNQELVRIEIDNPSNVSTIGQHGLIDTANGRLRGLAFHGGLELLFSIRADFTSTTFEETLVSIDPLTGIGEDVISLGVFPRGAFDVRNEALTFDQSRGLIVSQTDQSSSTSSLSILGLDGTTSPIVDNGRDNDFIAFDQVSGRLLSMDDQGLGLFSTDLSDGTTSPTLNGTNFNGGLTAVSNDPGIFLTYDNSSQSLVEIETDLSTFANLRSLGVAGVDGMRGTAFGISTIPEPSSAIFLAFSSIWILVRKRRPTVRR